MDWKKCAYFDKKMPQILGLHHVELLYLYSIAYYVAIKKT